jgi:predicted dehydrogenase
VVPEIAGGGYFYDVGCHALDILFYLFGDPFESMGVNSNRGGLYEPEDTIAASLLLPGNIPVAAGWNFVTPEPHVRDRVEILAEFGTLEFSVFSFDPITVSLEGKSEKITPAPPEHIQMPMIRSIVEELQGPGRCPSTGETAAVTSRVMEEILAR